MKAAKDENVSCGDTQNNKCLRGYKTCELVEELKSREAVECRYVSPYGTLPFSVNGPAVVLIVTD